MEFGILGPLQVTALGREVEISANRHRALLAALLLRPNQLVSTAELATYLWDDRPPGAARSTTQTYIRRLRAILGVGVIETRPGGYLISVAPDQFDLARFDGLLRQAHQSRQPQQEAALLREALELWRGPALTNVESDALHREQVPALAERRLRAVERQLELDLAAGRHHDAVVELQALTVSHPLRERFWEQLMTALARCGRPAEALRVYEDLRQRLSRELGTDPSPPVQQLHRRILRGHAPVGESDPRSVPPLPVPPPAQLPPAATRFVGRADALARLTELDAGRGGDSDAVAIWVIEGVAGVGKTALAVLWAHRAREHYPDGQLYLNLRGYADRTPAHPVEALGSLLTALGVPPEQVPADLEPAAALYRSRLAGRRMLIVLDDAAHPEQVRPLLPGSGACPVLVTSRNRLAGLAAREGARRMVLNPLSCGEATALLVQLLAAARLPEPPTAAELTELAELCGHLPLALRIAAANLTGAPALPVRDYLARLRATDRMAALTVAGDPRATVPAAFNLSYQRLPEPARELLRRLGLLPGPDTTAAAAAAFAGTTTEPAEQLLQLLADAHLLEQPAPGRYAMHDLLRAYAAQRAVAEDECFDRRRALARLYQHYLSHADAAARLLYPRLLRLPDAPAGDPASCFNSDRLAAIGWLDAERHNLVAVITHTAHHGPPEVAWHLSDALRGYFSRRMPGVDWLIAAIAGLTAADAAGDARAQAAAQLNLGSFWFRHGRQPRALTHYRRALTLTRTAGWIDGEASVHASLGEMLLHSGPPERAAAHLHRALRSYQQIGRRERQASVLTELGHLCLRTGRLSAAADYAGRALALSREVGSDAAGAVECLVLGEVHQISGRVTLASEHFQQALRSSRTVGDRLGEAQSCYHLAVLHRDAGDYRRAVALASVAASGEHATGRSLKIALLTVLSSAQLRLGQSAAAGHSFRRAAELAGRHAAPQPPVEVTVGLATVEQELGDPESARARLHAVLGTVRRSGHRLVEGHVLAALAATHLAAGRRHRAAQLAEQARAIHRETGWRLLEARCELLLGRAQELTAPARAIAHWQRALALFAGLYAPEAEQVRALLAASSHRRGGAAGPSTPPG